MTQAIPYLAFNGNCAEAMRFYEKAIGGKLQMMMTGGESPMKDQMPPELWDRIVHARLALPGGGMIYGGDCPPQVPYQGIHGVSLTLDFDTVAEAERVFAALSEGGQVMMPMQDAFWAKRWGMVIDRFGASWGVNGEQIEL